GLPAGATLDPATGAFSWTPTAAQAGSYTVVFRVTDDAPAPLADAETVVITVGAPAPPTIPEIPAQKVAAGGTVTFTVQATDSDGNPVTITPVNLPDGAAFDAATGEFSWTPTADQVGPHTLLFTATTTGPNPVSATRSVTVVVGDAPLPPVLPPIGDQVVPEGGTVSFVVGATDSDGNPVDLAATNLPAGAMFDPATGTFTWTPAAGVTGTFNVTFTATTRTDPPVSSSQTVSLTVGSANRPPVLTVPVTAIAVDAGAAVEFAVTATDPDGDAVDLAVANLPAGATFTNGTFRWTPDSSQAGTHEVLFSATDSGTPPETRSVPVRITVRGSGNQPPVLDPIGNRRVNVGELLAISLSATDPNGDALTFGADPMPTGATLTGTTFTWTPDTAGNTTVTFSVTDGEFTDSEDVVITVDDPAAGPTNAPPVLEPVGNRTVVAGSTLTIVLRGSDPDGDALTFSADGLPAGATLDPATRTLTWTPSGSQVGDHTVTFKVSDGSLEDTKTVTLTVTAAPSGGGGGGGGGGCFLQTLGAGW
ncbi:MAG: hypothetical protein D6708_16430, partial [Candidatus Dadabacteria bacterium]